MPSAMFCVAINTRQPPEPKGGDCEANLGVGPSTAGAPAAAAPVHMFDAIMEAVGAELSHTLEELQAQHGRLQQRAVRLAVSQAAARLAPQQRSPRGRRPSACEEQLAADMEGRASTKSGLAYLELPPAEWKPGLETAGGLDGTSWVLGQQLGRSPRTVQTFLPGGGAFVTTEPPEMEAEGAGKLAPELPALDLASIPAAEVLTPSQPLWKIQQELSQNFGSARTQSSADTISDINDGAYDLSSDGDGTGDGTNGTVSFDSQRPTEPSKGEYEEETPARRCLAWSAARRAARRVVEHWTFEIWASLLVAAHALAIGAHASYAVEGEAAPVGLRWARGGLFLAFLVELLARAAAPGAVALRCRWMALDAVLALCGLVHACGAPALLGDILVVRLLRLLRAAGRLSAGGAIQCRSLWLVTQSLLGSVVPTLLTAAAFFCWLYVYVVLGAVLIEPTAEYGDEYLAVAEAHFSGLGASALALLSVATLGGVPTVCSPLVMARPSLALYFGTFLLVAPACLASAVVAAAVDVRARLGAAWDGAEPAARGGVGRRGGAAALHK